MIDSKKDDILPGVNVPERDPDGVREPKDSAGERVEERPENISSTENCLGLPLVLPAFKLPSADEAEPEIEVAEKSMIDRAFPKIF